MTGGHAPRDQTWPAMAAFALVAVLGVLTRPLLPVDETRYLAVAWEMRLGGDWIVPHLNGAPYSHKPPLLFWLINLVWAGTGVSATAARLVGPAFGVAAIWATSRLARRLWPEDAGIGGRAAMVLAGFGAFALFAGLTMFDAMLTVAVIGGVFSIWTAGRAWRGWVALGVALALGALAKGPVILIHLAPLALSAPLWAGVAWRRTLLGFALALGVGLGLVALWLVPAVITGGAEYRDAVLWTQSAGRMTESFAHARPWWFFLALAPAVLWPFAWSPSLWRRIAALNPRGEPGLRLATIWVGSALALFSLMSGKQIHYLLPALPAVALIFARAMRGAPIGAWPAALPPGIIGIACFAIALGFVPKDLALVPRSSAHMAAIGLGCLGLAALAFRLRGTRIAWLGLSLVALANLVFAPGAPGRVYDASTIAALIAPSDAAGIGVLGNDYNGEFTFAARLRNPVALLSPGEAADWLAADPDRALVARLDRDHPSGEPRATVIYRAHAYGVWGGPDNAPKGAKDVALD
ncbi:glycosyltransferase family 39 protein [uncultured Amaricoccus sp.]|uniref:ArnT family glycosyltransferase n=1 Tax=uncultured Amaricoccus sp. TaxID=339341 RepID=UPI002633140E|nr:glycosyltransferase family 39 protein [uncultured Amaricoccus sp.]